MSPFQLSTRALSNLSACVRHMDQICGEVSTVTGGRVLSGIVMVGTGGSKLSTTQRRIISRIEYLWRPQERWVLSLDRRYHQHGEGETLSRGDNGSSSAGTGRKTADVRGSN